MASTASTVLITGTSSGIGRATAHGFADAGWNVVATMRDPQAAGDLAERDNVAMEHPEIVEAIKAAITKHRAGMERRPPLFDQRFLELDQDDRVTDQ